MKTVAAAVLVVLLSIERPAAAQDADADLVPSVLRDEPAPKPVAVAPMPRSPLRTKLFLENATTLASAPQTLVVPFPSRMPDWQNRTSFDARITWTPAKRLTVTWSDRLNVIEQDGQDVLSWQTVRNDLREGYVTWEPALRTYLEAGRINVRSGIALGFNPTDFFKARSLVGQPSLDPSVVRQNRLGALMVRGQTIWNGGSASVSFAPKVADPPDVVDPDRNGLDPKFDATNAGYRLLCTLSFDVLDLNPELLAYLERDRSKVGVNLSRPIGDSIVAYGEWAAGRETNLATRAVGYGQTTGTFPPEMPVLLPTDTSAKLRNDVAAGFSWTIATKVTLNAEYHLHQAGFTRQDWRSWFDVGKSSEQNPISSALWYLRGYAIDQQEPTSMHQLFFRAVWPKAFVRNLELSGIAFVSLLDGSILTQVSANHQISSGWSVAAYGATNIGDSRTERGSLPQRVSATMSVFWYL